jgi:hypothetical protein
MGKKNRKKSRAKNFAAQKQRVKPDDYFRHGPIEMARFGKFMVIRSLRFLVLPLRAVVPRW